MTKTEADILGQWRQKIDEIDVQILDLIRARFDVVETIGGLKHQHGIPVVRPERVDIVINRARYMAKERSLNPDMLEAVYRAFIDEAHHLESKG